MKNHGIGDADRVGLFVTSMFCCAIVGVLLAGCSGCSSSKADDESYSETLTIGYTREITGQGSDKNSDSSNETSQLSLTADKESTQGDNQADSSSDTNLNGEGPSTIAVDGDSAVGMPIEVQTSNGKLEITVDGFETSADMRDRYTYWEKIDEGKTIGVLLLKVKNVSYTDEYNEGRVSVETAVYPVDGDGFSLDCLSSAYDYGEYSGAAGGFFDLRVGQAKREALFYIVDKGITNITIVVDGVEVPVNVATT